MICSLYLDDSSEEYESYINLGRSGIWPSYWCSYIVAGHRYVNATMKTNSKKKRGILEDLEHIFTKVEQGCLPNEQGLRDPWVTRSPSFLTGRLPALKAAHLTVLVDLHQNFFETGRTDGGVKISNDLLCRISEMIDVLHPYLVLANQKKGYYRILHGTPFEKSENVLADERFDEIKEFCEEATMNSNITALIG